MAGNHKGTIELTFIFNPYYLSFHISIYSNDASDSKYSVQISSKVKLVSYKRGNYFFPQTPSVPLHHKGAAAVCRLSAKIKIHTLCSYSPLPALRSPGSFPGEICMLPLLCGKAFHAIPQTVWGSRLFALQKSISIPRCALMFVTKPNIGKDLIILPITQHTPWHNGKSSHG